MTSTANPSSDLDQDVIVITGASRGIGAAAARRVARLAAESQRPTHVVVNYLRNVSAAEAVVADVVAAGSDVHATAVQADVGSPEGVIRLFAAADSIGPVTGLVNNAGVVGTMGAFIDVDPERLERTWAINISGPFLCAQQAVRRMSTAHGGQGGVIVNVSSRAASFGSPNEFIDYAASKGALDTMTVGLATEVARQGIRVNAVRPGLIDTDIHTDAGQPDRVRALAPNVPIGRGGTAEEVANLIAWLLSEEASYVTGALMDIGGGR